MGTKKTVKRKRGSTWSRPGINRTYQGSHTYAEDDRVFQLTHTFANGKTHVISFESFQAAKLKGWVIVNAGK